MERSFWSTIRGKLLSRTLIVVLIPVLIIGGAAIASLLSLSGTADESVVEARTTLSEDVVGSRVAGVSKQIAREIAIFLDERLTDAEGWSNDRGLIDAARSAADRAAGAGLAGLTIEQLEAQFAGEPRLGDTAAEQDLVNAVAATPAFKEIFFTDVNGFNVDYSNETSDFVQSDEDWWINAMDNGLDISEPEFDASAGVFAVDISIRLEDNGQPVGVLKGALDINVVQIIADRFARGPDSFDISIVEPLGRFLAETASAHEAERIMSTTLLATDPGVASEHVREAFAPGAGLLHPNGFSINDQGVGGFADVGDELAAVRGQMGTALQAFDWTVVVEQPSDVAFAALAPLEGLADQVSSTSRTLSILLVLVAMAGTIAAAMMALVFARRITSPIAALRDAAMTAATVTLPNVVAQIDALEPDEELPELEAVTLNTGDEVEDLAHSFNTVQQTAANLASGQARMRRKNVATTFVNLGRRNQNLLSRQLEHINSMESNETNSETLQRLFQLDHLATRMRRNAESLLVLAGEETPRRFRQPVSMHQLLQAAGGEIEDFDRIEITSLEEASIEGGVASDVAHLLAELLENASSFSPPGTPIQVHGRRRAHGYSLAIVDQGIGMDEPDMDASNARLADPAEFDRAPSAYLGHFVVGHLAKRHGIRVRLNDSPYGGLTAQLHLPASAMAMGDGAARGAVGDASAPPSEDQESATELTQSEVAQFEAMERALLEDSNGQPHQPVEAVVTTAPAAGTEAVAHVAPPQPVAPPMAPVAQPIASAPEPVAPPMAPVAQSIAPAPEPVAPPMAPVAQPMAPAPEPVAQPMAPVAQAAAPAFESVAEPIAQAPMPIAAPAPEAVARPLQPVTFPGDPVQTSASAPADAMGESPATGQAETTPSGFRRRRRGQEGAPQPLAPVPGLERATPVTRRSPEEVQASLSRFRLGVEAGRARASNTENLGSQPDFGGDQQ